LRHGRVQEFIGFLAVGRGLAARTLKEYERDLHLFWGYFEPHLATGLTLSGFDERTLREFFAWLKVERSYTPPALNRKLACLKAYFKFLEKEGYIELSPMRDMRTVKLGRHLPKVLSQQDMTRLLAPRPRRAAHRPEENAWQQARDHAVVELFYATGVRVSELVSIDVEHLDFENLMLKVRGKGNKERMVLMNETCAHALVQWLGVRPPAATRALFVSRLKKRMSVRSVENLVDRELRSAGIEKAASPHTLRHSFGTHMVEGGADLMAVKELLGHENLSTTQIYVNIAMQHIKDVYRKTHPRSQTD
jgi:site-specific recombinase XerD